MTVAGQVWHAPKKGIRLWMPRWERLFLTIPGPLVKNSQTLLTVKGVVKALWFNGTCLTKQAQGYVIPYEIQKPWENEVLIQGIPLEARIETPDRQYWSHRPSAEHDPIIAAGDALTGFLVSQGGDTGDMFSFFDPVDETFRMPSWRWDTGICLEALSRLAAGSGQERFKAAVIKAADRLVQVQEKEGPCKGGFPEAADLHMTGKKEPVLPQWVVPFNGAFIGAGLLAAADLLNGSRAARYRKAAYQAFELMVEKGISDLGGLKGYYHVKTRQWAYHGQINDSCIFPRLARLLDAKGLVKDREKVFCYTNSMVELIRPKGYVGRAVWQPGPHTWTAGQPLFPEWRKQPDQIPAKIFARGQAWFLLGASGAWTMNRDRALARHINGVVQYLLAAQDRTGLWHHDLGQPGQGLDIKGSAVVTWALLEARLPFLEAGGDKRALEQAVDKAWEALLNNQKKHGSGPLPGALVDEGREGAIIYFRNRPMYVAYGSAAFILAGLLRKEEI